MYCSGVYLFMLFVSEMVSWFVCGLQGAKRFVFVASLLRGAEVLDVRICHVSRLLSLCLRDLKPGHV